MFLGTTTTRPTPPRLAYVLVPNLPMFLSSMFLSSIFPNAQCQETGQKNVGQKNLPRHNHNQTDTAQTRLCSCPQSSHVFVIHVFVIHVPMFLSPLFPPLSASRLAEERKTCHTRDRLAPCHEPAAASKRIDSTTDCQIGFNLEYASAAPTKWDAPGHGHDGSPQASRS